VTAPANLRGWGQGWPVDRSADMTWVRAARSGARWQVHELIAPIVSFVVNEVERRGYLFDHGPADVDDEWGYNNRPIRGKRVPSNHSWGLAIDIDATQYPMGTRRNPPAWIVSLFEAHGFEWGGRWKRPDPMHFEFTGWPSDARRITAQLSTKPSTSPFTTGSPSTPKPPGDPDMVRFLTSHAEYGSRLVVISDDQGYRESGVATAADANAFAQVVPSIQLSPKALQDLRAMHQATTADGRVR